jgi:hypothetical protein
MCDCKQFCFNKKAIITKKVISINQLNYKAPEKSHATEELVGYKEQRGTFWSLHDGHCAEGHYSVHVFLSVHKCAHIIECYYCNQCSLLYVSRELIICMSALIWLNLSVMHNLKYSTCQNICT